MPLPPVTLNPPYPSGDSAGNLKLNAGGKTVLCRFVARHTGLLTKLHFQVRNLFADGSSYTGGTLGTYRCELRKVRPLGQPDTSVAGLLASETFAAGDARTVNYCAYMNISPLVFVIRGEEMFLCLSNTDTSPTVNYASVNFLYQETSPLPGAQGRNERSPDATDIYLSDDPRECVGGTSDGGATYQIPGNTDPGNTLIKHIFCHVQEYTDGTKIGPIYYTPTGSTGNADGAWVMTNRGVTQTWRATHVGAWLQSPPGSSSVEVKVNAVSRGIVTMTGAAYGFNTVPLPSPVDVPIGATVTLSATVDSTAAAGINCYPVYTRSEWLALVGGTAALDWEATTKPAAITGAYVAVALPLWLLPWKDQDRFTPDRPPLAIPSMLTGAMTSG